MGESATFNLLHLADIARDRTAQGRARLFALLAALLCERWTGLTARERDMLAELLIVLVPRADPADRERLGRHLATRPAIPTILQPLVMPPPAAGKKGPTITITSPIGATVRTWPARPSRARPRLTVTPLRISLRPDRQRNASPQVEPAAQTDMRLTPSLILPAAPQPGTPAASSLCAAPPAPGGARIEPAAPTGTSPADSSPTDSSPTETTLIAPSSPAPASPIELPARSQPSSKISNRGQTTVMTSSMRAEPGSPLDEMLAAPRPNPHRVTVELLSDVLAQDDLPRFEVMLAHLCKLRAPLLRRLLRDGGSESFAILGRAAGLNASQFETQWQDWRRQMSELDRLIGLPDRRDARRIGAFFAALTDKQVDRLIQRWRSDGARLFSEPGG
ncbi:DUF2336 domain-containing protein [Dongia soli]|uniref:DUF2336 domain-containing protein n=1 Tax=Dongia soli TaxID=600628 RepID=A0ABU5E7I1_9PROT|nr:DUF2336 domain-containing protein [Dongia soli]MDY0882256.1 DUF2336 domain-containing protein [Dongia soli]